MSGDIDPVAFGEMCAHVKSTFRTVEKMDRKLDGYGIRLTNLENVNRNREDALRNKKENARITYKRLGMFFAMITTIVGGGFAFLKWVLSSG